MNFPPALEKSKEFQSMILNLNNIQNNNYFYDPSIKFHQELAKKLYKKHVDSVNLYSQIENWLKSLKFNKLIKICSINNKWFLDILHQMIILDKKNTNLKFIFQKNSNFNIYSNKRFNSYLKEKNLTLDLKNLPIYNNYFSIRYSSVIQLSKNLNKHYEISNEFINELRYLSIKSNELQNQNNNILTLSHYLLNNVDKLLEYFKEISNEKCFSEIIEISQINIDENNFFYNFNLPNWFLEKNNFTLSELICCYFEQIILLNFQHKILDENKKEIIFPYDSDFNDFIENNKNIYEFLDNSVDKIKIFKTINFKVIEDEIKSNKIKEEIKKRSEIDKFIILKETNEYPNSNIINFENQINIQINDIYLHLFKIYEHSIKKFIDFLYFIIDDNIFTVIDFVYKKVLEQIKEQYNIKKYNDFMKEMQKKKKKKKRRRRRKIIIMKILMKF